MKRKSKFHAIYIFSHRWLGLVVGLYFALLGISGSYLVYSDSFDRWLFPALRISEEFEGAMDIGLLVAAAKKGLGTELEPISLKIPEASNRNVELGFNIPTPSERRRFMTAFVNPATLEFVGFAIFKDTLKGFLFRFHHDLFWGPTGKLIVALGGIFMLLILFTGLYLWWPTYSFLRNLKLGLMRTPYMANYELHRFTGFYSLILLALVTFSGIYIAQPSWFSKPRPPAAVKTESAPLVLNYQKIQFLVDELGLSSRPLEIRLNARSSTLSVQGYKNDRIFEQDFDLVNLDIKDTELEKTSSQKMHQLQRDIHGGHFWGALGQALIFLSGLLAVFFYVTGFVIWLKKRKMKRT